MPFPKYPLIGAFSSKLLLTAKIGSSRDAVLDSSVENHSNRFCAPEAIPLNQGSVPSPSDSRPDAPACQIPKCRLNPQACEKTPPA
ncbi:hypothetical protein BH24CHL4_BH24CHL4_18310 [soil metagenome]